MTLLTLERPTEELKAPENFYASPNDERKYGTCFDAEPHLRNGSDKLGLSETEDGYSFAIRARNAQFVDFCITDPSNPKNLIRYRLESTEDTEDGANVFTGKIKGLKPGDLYQIRVHREDDPAMYETPLLDPYAYAITRNGNPDHPDSPAYGVVMKEEPQRHIERPKINPKDRVILESHVVDSTKLNSDIPEDMRGTYLGVAHPANISRLKEMGITTIELMPIMQFFTEQGLTDHDRKNHWGYNTIGFMAPHEGYAHNKEPGAAVEEVKQMIDALHTAGIEVILDVVYNHTAEGPPQYHHFEDPVQRNSPTYSFRGLDEEGYYFPTYIDQDADRRYIDHTGCGNMLRHDKPAASQLMIDSLDYWYNVIGIDGVRLDLAAALARHGDNAEQVDVKNSRLVEALKNDDRLKGLNVIAEYWDLGPNGQPAGHFIEQGIAEWSGEFRDKVRKFWLWRTRKIGELATLMTRRGAINFITAHDGFTLRDLTEHNSKNNLSNGENNRDGVNDNYSYDHGEKGATKNETIKAQRRKIMRNLVLTLILAEGTPMILDGDQLRHTKLGNNNTFCQDNKRSWIRHLLFEGDVEMKDFIAKVIEIRKNSSIGDETVDMGVIEGSPTGERGVDWFNANGQRMDDWDWNGDVFGMYRSGIVGRHKSESLLIYVNGSDDDRTITLPRTPGAKDNYELLISTEGKNEPDRIITSERVSIGAMSMIVMRRKRPELPTDKPDSIKQQPLQVASLPAVA